jgi:radical SAM superfamily enzyme YgiQ (UPF0313 family)
MKYNIILFTDIPNPDHFTRGYGAYRLASELRKHGYTVLTVDFSSTISMPVYERIIAAAVGPETLFVGFSTTWFPFRETKETNTKYILGAKSRIVDPRVDFDPKVHHWYFNSLTYRAANGHLSEYRDVVKRYNPETKVIVGGAKSSDYVHEDVDNVFIGYSENQLLDYANSLSGKGPRRIFNKVINYDVKGVIGPFDFRNCTTEYVDTDLIMSEELLTMEFGRGCIFNCAFCSFPHRSQNTRDFLKYKETIRKELMDNYTKWGVYKYTINDDTFNDHTEKLIAIKEVIESLPFKPVFAWAYARLDLLARNPEQAQLIKDIGIKEVFYGLETFNDETSKSIRKGGKREKKIEGMRIGKECWGDDITISVGLVVGLPKETRASVNESVEWYITEGHKYVDNFKFNDLTIFPDTGLNQFKVLSDIEKDPEKFGYSFPDPINKPFNWVLNDGSDITTKQEAIQVASESIGRVAPYFNKARRGEWDSFTYYLSEEEDGMASAYHVFVVTNYLPKLLALLEQ